MHLLHQQELLSQMLVVPRVPDMSVLSVAVLHADEPSNDKIQRKLFALAIFYTKELIECDDNPDHGVFAAPCFLSFAPTWVQNKCGLERW